MRETVAEWCGIEASKLNKSHFAATFAAFSTIQVHEVMQNVLAARHVFLGFIEIGSEQKKPNIARRSKAFDYVFPASVNRSFRHLIASSAADERSVFKGARAVASDRQSPFNARAHAVYLLGRMRSASYREHAKTELHKLEGEVDKLFAAAVVEQTDEDVRGGRLFRRGIFISQAYVGVPDATKRYVDLILRNEEENRLNRGFHLEYYGDLEYTPVSGLAHEDPEDERFMKTFHELRRRLLEKLSDGGLKNNDFVAPIEVATLTSIIQTRHEKGLLKPDLIDESKGLLDQLLRQDFTEYPRLGSYVATIRRNLESEEFSQVDLISFLYRLNDEIRAGWIDRSKVGFFDITGRIESVAEHTLFAYYLALFLLPPWNHGLGEKYDKTKVQEMLLVHDLAEAFTGDHIPGDGHDESSELNWFKYIRNFDTYRDIFSTNSVFLTYEEFFHLGTIEARIAKDIDRLENLVKLYRYRQRMDKDEFLRWEDSLINKIGTTPGRHILRVVHALRDRQAEITSIFRGPRHF